MQRKRLQHRAMTIWTHGCIQVRVERDNDDHTYTPSVGAIRMINELINQPGRSPVVDLYSSTLEYYFLRNIGQDELSVSDDMEDEMEIDGKAYQIPY